MGSLWGDPPAGHSGPGDAPHRPSPPGTAGPGLGARGQGEGSGTKGQERPGERPDSPPSPAPVPLPAPSRPRLPRGSALAFRFPLKSGKLLFTRQREKFCLFSTSVRAASGYRAPNAPGRTGREGADAFGLLSSARSHPGKGDFLFPAPAGIFFAAGAARAGAGGWQGMNKRRGCARRGHRGPVREMPTAPGCGNLPAPLEGVWPFLGCGRLWRGCPRSVPGSAAR